MKVRFDGEKDGPDRINFMGLLVFEKGKVRDVDEHNVELGRAIEKLRSHRLFTIVTDGDADIREAPPMSAAVTALCEEYEIEPAKVEGSGKNGRVVKADVVAYIERHGLAARDEEEEDEDDEEDSDLDPGDEEDEDYT